MSVSFTLITLEFPKKCDVLIVELFLSHVFMALAADLVDPLLGELEDVRNLLVGQAAIKAYRKDTVFERLGYVVEVLNPGFRS